mgnify:FL=1
MPATEMTWLIQPITVTVSKFNYDTTQTKFLIAIVEGLQQSIKQSISKSVEQLPLFSDGMAENELKLEIPLKTIGADPRRYAEIKQSLIKLATTPFEMPVKDVDGKRYNRYSGLCEVYVPEEKYVRSVIVKIKKDIAKSLVDASAYGYQKYLKQVICRTKNKYTQRIYLLITAWKTMGTTEIKVSTLRAILQLENKYPRWNSFYSIVIKSAQEELKEKFEAGLCECFFEAEPVYLTGKKCGEPNLIRFRIQISAAEKANMQKRSFVSLRIEIEEKLRVNFKIKKYKRESLLRMIGEDNIQLFSDFLITLVSKIERERCTITDVEAYSYQSCMNFLKQHYQIAEEVKDPKKHQTLLESEKPDDLSDIYSKQIALFEKNIKKRIGDDAFKVWIEPIRFAEINKTEDGMDFVLEVPSTFFYEILEEKYVEDLSASLKYGFKRQVHNLKYRVVNNDRNR